MSALQQATQVIGIDCATESKKVGLALGRFTTDGLKVTEARCGGTPDKLLAMVCEWLASAERILLALDAPLGWPNALRKALAVHSAGQKIDVDGAESQSAAAELLFRRKTDREVTVRCGKRPLDVGADRIARTGHAALVLLDALRRQSRAPIPLAWSPGFAERCAAIEVYPAATLTSRKIDCSNYKGNTPDDRKRREKILDSLRDHLTLRANPQELLNDADVLDAVVCTLAAADFLRGDAHPPDLEDHIVRQEGWIWTKLPPNKDSAS
jgi:hypothetical protein